jgi:hypothetical protein
MKYWSLLGVLFCFGLQSWAQINPKDSTLSIQLIGIGVGQQQPVGLLAKRFGTNSNLSLQFEQQKSSGFRWGAQATLIFGNILVEDTILKALTLPTGDLITESGIFGNYKLSERGLAFHVSAGYRFRSSWAPNPSSGFVLNGGIGFLGHKIRIEAPYSNIPSIQKEYKKGYDRLTFGPSAQCSFGYQFLGNDRKSNFYIGLDYCLGLTQNRRTINFDSGIHDGTKRMDQLIGIKGIWILPLYKRAENDYYFFD